MKIAVIGGGFGGLSSGWLLKKAGINFKVFEKAKVYGGLARSFDWHGFKCDIASHRLFTRDQEVLNTLKTLVPLKKQVRQSKIYIGGKWIKDPVSPIELVLRFFPQPGLSFVIDFLFKEKLNEKADLNFDNYVLAKYGKGLNNFFFKPYTEKLFGIPADKVSVEWAKQKVRVSGLIDLLKKNTKIYFSYFHYPETGGIGAFVDYFYNQIRNNVQLSSEVRALHLKDNQIVGITYETNGVSYYEPFDAIISTMPITKLSRNLGYRPELFYRKVQIVYLLINKPRLSVNHWIYFAHDDVAINRMGEMKNFSDINVPGDKTVLCIEVTRDISRDKLVNQIVSDLQKIGFIDERDILDTYVVNEEYGYPIYGLNYTSEMNETSRFLNQFTNLYSIGRFAEFKHKEIDDIFKSANDLVNMFKTKSTVPEFDRDISSVVNSGEMIAVS